MSPRRDPARSYGLTPWARAWLDVIEHRAPDIAAAAHARRVTKARSYFRDRHVHRLTISPGRVTASVQGSQLDPFDVTLTMRAVDPPTVATLLCARDAGGDLVAITRGEQPRALGELVLPTESADIASQCTCPDDTLRCIHVLAVAFEVAAEIDRNPTTLLTVMGTDLAELVGEVHAATRSGGQSDSATETLDAPGVIVDYYGTTATLPPLPSPPRMSPLTDLDAGKLRAALRASGVPPTDLAEAVDELGALYDVLLPE
ncbi:SWIM zinc finger family protein [Gordonia sp. NPDC003424]